MPQTLYDMLGLLQTTAQARPDINTPGSTGVLENSRPYTFAGRVGDANRPSNMATMLSRVPTESPDAEGMGGAVAAGLVPMAGKKLATQVASPMLTLDVKDRLNPQFINSMLETGSRTFKDDPRMLQNLAEFLGVHHEIQARNKGVGAMAVPNLDALHENIGTNAFQRLIKDMGYGGLEVVGMPPRHMNVPTGVYNPGPHVPLAHTIGEFRDQIAHESAMMRKEAAELADKRGR